MSHTARTDVMSQRTAEEWIQYGHDHIHEILADALRWQDHVRQELDELDWMREDPLGWYMDTFAEARIEARKLIPAIAAMKSARAVRDARAKPGPIHELRATQGWPPIAIPGRPGWRRQLVNGKQTDQNRTRQETAA